MHVYLLDAKGSELYMQPLIEQLRNGIPLTPSFWVSNDLMLGPTVIGP